jgi:sugar lactone lactonase YvrE
MYRLGDLWDTRCMLGEAPLWCPELNSLIFVDILKKHLHCLSMDHGHKWRILLKESINSIVPVVDGTYCGVTDCGLLFFKLNPFSIIKTYDYQIDKRTRFNDAKCDLSGRLWITSMDRSETAPIGSLWLVDQRLSLKKVDSGYIVGNGIGQSMDGSKLYVADSVRRTIFIYDLMGHESTNPPLRSVFARIPENLGLPDGLTIDSEGRVWIALWDGGALLKYSADGSTFEQINLPVQCPTSLCFGGADFNKLFVTSATSQTKKGRWNRAFDGALCSLSVPARGNDARKFAYVSDE